MTARGSGAEAGGPTGEPLLPPEGEEAINWMVRLSSPDASARDQEGFDRWLKRSPGNRAMWARLTRSVGPLGVAARYQGQTGAFGDSILHKSASRRGVLRSLTGVAIVGGAAAGIADRFVPLSAIGADHFTRTAQRETVALEDGSQLVLGPYSAVDIDFDVARRAVSLRQGELLLQGRMNASKSLVIRAGGLSLEAGGGTFVVRMADAITEMTAVDAPAQVSRAGYQTLALDRGMQARSDGIGLTRHPAKLRTETSWVEGLLVANSETLAFVVGRLRPYFSGVIRVAPSVAGKLVTGVFPLNNLDGSLGILADALDLSVGRATPYWITIGPKGTA